MNYKVERLGHQGDGIAAGPVYVPMGLPGDVVTGHLDGGRLSNMRITTPSDYRVKADCKHYKFCGGCQVMHADNEFVAEWKLDVVQTALDAQGILTEFRPVLTSRKASRRRATFAVRRTKSGTLAGFHARGSDTIVDVTACQLIEPALAAGLDFARAVAPISASRKAVLSVQCTVTMDGLDVVVRGAKPMQAKLFQDLGALIQNYDIARLSWEDEVVFQHRPPRIAFDGVDVVAPAGGFLQATEDGQKALLSAVSEVIGERRNRVVDLFAGCGTFALPLARHAAVHAVESEKASLSALYEAWRHSHGLKGVTTEIRDLFRCPLVEEELNQFDAAVLDPPRAGAHAQVAEIASSKLKTVAFVSCNPVTFARDARVLCDAGFRLSWVQVVDQFRWSTHVELAAAFQR